MADEMVLGALEGLKRAREEQARRVAREQAELARLDDVIARLEATPTVDSSAIPQRKDFTGLGIVEATKRWFSEAGEEKTTPEIAAALLARGVETRSKNWVPTVYATLANSGEFDRRGTGRGATWILKKSKRGK